MTLAFFSEIKDVIIKLIDTSKSEISIAVAWFTHRDLYQALLNALDRNVQVSIILIDDIINRGPNALDFTLFINKGGKVRFMNTKKILMHNKFCIFDKEALITGSYNWTYSAELRNAENIIFTSEKKVCQGFQQQFEKLWATLPQVDQFTRIDFSDVESTTLLSCIDDLREEYVSMEQANLPKQYAAIDIDNLKKDISVTRLNTIVTNTKRSNPRLKANIGMRCVIDGVPNKTLNIIKQGQILPHTNCVNTETLNDYQKSIICDIVYGNDDDANKNEPLVQIRIDDLPNGKAGEITFQTRATIDTNGYMNIEFVCINNGVSKSKTFDAKDRIDYQ